MDKQLSVPTSPNASLNMSFEEKMDVDNRSVYIGQCLATTVTSGHLGLSQEMLTMEQQQRSWNSTSTVAVPSTG